MKAIARSIRITPKKANLVAGLIRKKPTEEALNILKYTPKKAAGILYKVVHSAVSNAVNNFKQDQKSLIIKEIIVNKGPTLKRSVPISRGRVHPILKRTSHITVTLGVEQTPSNSAETAKKSTNPESVKSESSEKATKESESTTKASEQSN